MKVTVNRDTLNDAIVRIARVVERRNTIPILANVLLDVSGAALSLKATDLDIEVTDRLDAKGAKNGSVTVPAVIMRDIMKKLPSGSEVLLELGASGDLAVRSGRSRFTLRTLPTSDFPDLAQGELPCVFKISAKDIRDLIDKTAFAISSEETRYYLNGIYLHIATDEKKPTLRSVSTDGHRLAQAEIEAPEGCKQMPGVIVPKKTVSEVANLVANSDPKDELTVSVSTSKIKFEIGATIIVSKLIDGTFPDYKRVVPLSNNKEMKVDKTEFEAAVDRVSTVSSERGRAVKLSLTAGKLVMTVNNPDQGNAVEEMDVEYESEPLEIGFNSSYLRDIAAQLDASSKASLSFQDAGSPTLIRQDGDPSALYVLMPMRV